MFTSLRALSAALLLAAPMAAQGVLELSPIFQDGMVLQRESSITVSGSAVEWGPTVTVRASWPGGGEHEVVVDPSGQFSVDIATGAAGGPYQLTLVGAKTLTDIWLGEVWLCSGQSNMEWPVSASATGSATLAASSDAPADWDIPGIRLLELPRRTASYPLRSIDAEWHRCTPESAQGFSAVALHFASVLHQELGVPVGLIGTYWGGTPAESWTRAESLTGFPGQLAGLENLRRMRIDQMHTPSQMSKATGDWLAALDEAGVGPRSTPPTEGWQSVSLPQQWEKQGDATLANFDGLVWYRRELTVPESWVGKQVTMWLGPIDDLDVTTIDEALFVTDKPGSWQTARSYSFVPMATTSTVVVRAIDTGGAGGFGGEADSYRLTCVGETETIPLTDGWEMTAGPTITELPKAPAGAAVGPHTPSALYNGMIEPFVDFRIAGAIWYQGESNRARYEEYRALFPAMISDWRGAWGYDFPFYFVQIAPFGYGNDTGQAAELREAQRLALRLQHTGMASTMDIGNPKDIHPRNKHEVGRRLALWAMAKQYGRSELVHSGPSPAQLMTYWNDGLRLRFEHVGGGLTAPEGLKLFEAAGPDGVWHPAVVEIVSPSTVSIRCDAIEQIEQVRYAWGATDAAELFNAEGLPASSFRVSL